jgi:hypothetical protein
VTKIPARLALSYGPFRGRHAAVRWLAIYGRRVVVLGKQLVMAGSVEHRERYWRSEHRFGARLAGRQARYDLGGDDVVDVQPTILLRRSC